MIIYIQQLQNFSYLYVILIHERINVYLCVRHNHIYFINFIRVIYMCLHYSSDAYNTLQLYILSLFYLKHLFKIFSFPRSLFEIYVYSNSLVSMMTKKLAFKKEKFILIFI